MCSQALATRDRDAAVAVRCVQAENVKHTVQPRRVAGREKVKRILPQQLLIPSGAGWEKREASVAVSTHLFAATTESSSSNNSTNQMLGWAHLAMQPHTQQVLRMLMHSRLALL